MNKDGKKKKAQSSYDRCWSKRSNWFWFPVLDAKLPIRHLLLVRVFINMSILSKIDWQHTIEFSRSHRPHQTNKQCTYGERQLNMPPLSFLAFLGLLAFGDVGTAVGGGAVSFVSVRTSIQETDEAMVNVCLSTSQAIKDCCKKKHERKILNLER